MSLAIAREADSGSRAGNLQRHRPEQMCLYQLFEEYYPHFLDLLAAEG